jgi:hypothetical protein
VNSERTSPPAAKKNTKEGSAEPSQPAKKQPKKYGGSTTGKLTKIPRNKLKTKMLLLQRTAGACRLASRPSGSGRMMSRLGGFLNHFDDNDMPVNRAVSQNLPLQNFFSRPEILSETDNQPNELSHQSNLSHSNFAQNGIMVHAFPI